nr:PREDICTED: protein CROC-4 [Equus przewalskii]
MMVKVCSPDKELNVFQPTDATSSELHPPLHKRLGAGRERQSSSRGHRAVSLPPRSQELGIQEEAASFVSGVIVGGHLWLLGFSPGAGGCSTTLPPSFLHTCARATSSTTDSSRAPCSPASIFVTLVTLCPLRPLNLLARTQRPLLSSQVRDWTGASDWLSLDPTPRPQLQGGPGRCYAEEEGGIQSFFEELTVQQGRQTHNYMACGDCCPEDVCKVLWEQVGRELWATLGELRKGSWRGPKCW